MRIAHVITRMIVGGAQENTLLCCRDLMQRYGDDVRLITGPSLGPEGDLLSEGRAGDLPVIRVPSMRRAIHPWRDASSYRAIRRHLADFAPDVVHTHSAKGGILGRLAASRLRVPVIVHTVHGAPFHPYQNAVPRTLFRWCETYAAKHCHRLIGVADAMCDQLVAAGVAPREKFVTIYSGMEVQPFLDADRQREAIRGELGFKPEHVVVGKIARLFHLKGHEYLVRAASSVVQRCPQTRFLLVGDGILQPEIRRQIQEAGLEPYFHFTGLVPPERIPELLGAMDILAHVSLREGLARALPQALLAGKPVVSYDVDGAREVVIPDATGALVPPRSIQPLGEALIQLVEDPARRRACGEEGRRRFTERFRHETMTREIRDLYQRLLPSA
jgi:glycosyltransferase involved in cell wall biosynthesis